MTDKTARLEELRHKANIADTRYRNALDKHKKLTAMPKLREAVGRCYRYENRYSSGDSWPLYTKIVSLDENDCTFLCVQFQKKSDNVVEIELCVQYNWDDYENKFTQKNGHTEISVVDFALAVDELMGTINNVFHYTPKKGGRK